MAALTNFKKVIGKKLHGSGGKFLTRCVMSGCNDYTTVNLRTASYRLDYHNKLLLIELLKAMILKEDEIWDDQEIMAWIEKNQPFAYEEAKINQH